MKRKSSRPWSDEDMETLRRDYPIKSTSSIALDLGRDIRAIYQKAHALQLFKSPEYLASMGGRLNAERGYSTRFQPGLIPWNKDRKGWKAGGRSDETRFKHGHPPHNTKQIGEYRISSDGSLQRKISNERGSNTKRWRGVHELVWIAAHGPLPPGHIVVFKDKQRTTVLEDITLDRIECISLAENMRRNSRHRLPKELNDIIGLRAALIRKINNRTKHHEADTSDHI